MNRKVFVGGARVTAYNHNEGAGRLTWSGMYFDFTRAMIVGSPAPIMAGLVVSIQIHKLKGGRLDLLKIISPEMEASNGG